MFGLGVLKHLTNSEFKITKSSLLPGQDSTGDTTKYYSRVAEVNERGELSGDETTQSSNSVGEATSDEEEDFAV